MHHAHPVLRRPITSRAFLREIAWVWRRAGFERWMTYEVRFPESLSRRHCKNSRRYAAVLPGRKSVFEFAEQVLWLPYRNRIGLIAHEIGHVLAPGSERDADDAAAEILGIEIRYDRRWRGKGLQIAVQVS